MITYIIKYHYIGKSKPPINQMEDIFAYIKYEGELVKDGFLDARKSGEVLIGIDSVLRYFINYENPEFQKIDYELPVRIRRGSWEAIFPDNLDEALIKLGLLWGAKEYFGPALSEMAKNDFKNLGFKDIFKSAFKGLTWVIKLAIHLGSIKKKTFNEVLFSPDNKFIGIKNDYDRIIWIPVENLELFANCPENILVNLVRIVEDKRELVIGYVDKDQKKDNTEVRITNKNKFIFLSEDDSEEVIFPDLVHGNYVELIGYITRGNEKSNTLGFLYQGHILTCYPNEGNIKNYRQALFNNCLLRGYIDRLDKHGQIEKSPKIKITNIAVNDISNNQLKLF